MTQASCVVITGATSGIGERLAKDYAESGFHVYACGRNQEKLAALSSYSRNISTLQFDLTKLSDVKAAFVGLDIHPNLWIFNAGDCEYIDDGLIDAALISRIMEINVSGLANCIEASQRYYRSGDHIVVMGSIASEVALPRAEAYGASKAAVSYFARALHLALSPKGVVVTTVYPGFVATPLTDKNTFTMPMLISVEEASKAIMRGISKKRPHIYFPARFTSILRLIGLLPYALQAKLVGKLVA